MAAAAREIKPPSPWCAPGAAVSSRRLSRPPRPRRKTRMPDDRSVMKEYRSLDQKRRGQGLSSQEEARYEQLRDLVGAEPPAGAAEPARSAAAARAGTAGTRGGARGRVRPEPVRAAHARRAGRSGVRS